jgi:NhaP-type Na+/H+ or K+/H+ antiporter
MKPELFLIIFLPILLFASGSAMEWHTFCRNFPQIFSLAFPGVGLHMVLVAVVYKFAFPYKLVLDGVLCLRCPHLSHRPCCGGALSNA